MWIAVRANVRTAQAASESLSLGLRVAFNSGTVMGMSVVGFGLAGISALFLIFSTEASWNDKSTYGMGSAPYSSNFAGLILIFICYCYCLFYFSIFFLCCVCFLLLLCFLYISSRVFVIFIFFKSLKSLNLFDVL